MTSLTSPKRLRRGAAAVLAALLATAIAAPTAAAAKRPKAAAAPVAHDYTQTADLSNATYETEKEVVELPMHDGITVYLEITRPKQEGRWPVVLESSPYHGTLADRDGTRILPEPRDADNKPIGLTGYFAPKGYAVVMMDLRGTGRSQGCLDHLGPNDAQDIRRVVEWAAGQSWSNGRVGMTGHSYVGSTPSLGAAMRPNGLVTIVPSAGLARMYDHQFQDGVPFFLQWAGPMEAYEQIALQRLLPPELGPEYGDSFGKNTEYAGCGLPNSSLTAGEAQLSGEYTYWHKIRDWTADATAADIPVFMVHGVNDNAARVSGMEWFTERGGKPGDKLWLGQWDHGSGCCPTRRGIQWTYALHAWFDKHLAQRDVSTGPPVELFLSDGTFSGARSGDRTQIHVDTQWPIPSEQTLELFPSADGTLGTTRPADRGESSFAGDPSGFQAPQATGGVDFVSEPVTSDVLLSGQPALDLVASVTAPRVHVITTLYDESPADAEGNVDRRRISQFAINPELRAGLSEPSPAVAGEVYEMHPTGFAMAHDLRAGHRLVMRVTASDPDKVPTFAVDPNITVVTGPDGTALRVPVVTAPALVNDTVKFDPNAPDTPGRAQPTVRDSVTVPLPGAGVRQAGATSEYLEFEVLDGFDNAVLVAGAVPAPPADIDLYLQQQKPDGTWSDDIASGGIFDVTYEELRHLALEPGKYRIEAHEWAGAPATRVDLTLTFLNSVGEPGEG